ncbi:MAG: hypothetical protein IT168_02760 [Bryobacterales bacterium]|nr:hypothetical protein [Bryobacterales bacterium]
MRIVLSTLLLLVAGCSSKPNEVKEAASASKQDSTKPKITQFYASPNVVAPGERSLLCYGVENTTIVTMTPQTEDLTPSLSRCIEIHPTETTEYTLAAGGLGAAVTATTKVKVDNRIGHKKSTDASGKASAGLIRYFVANMPAVSKGQQVTMCYGTAGATSLTLDPPVQPVAPKDKICFSTTVNQTTTFTLTAKDGKGATDSHKLTIRAE